MAGCEVKIIARGGFLIGEIPRILPKPGLMDGYLHFELDF